MADVFISYAREDMIRVKPLVEALEGEGFSVWWDSELSPGDKFDDLIDDEIQAAACVVVLWTEGSVNSRWVKNEALEGMDRGILVPVLMDNVRLPVAFKQSQIADFGHWPESVQTDQYESFIQSVSIKVRGETIAEVDFSGVAGMQERGRKRFRRKRDFAVPALTLAVIALSVFVVFQFSRAPDNARQLARVTVGPFNAEMGSDSRFYASSLTRELQLGLDEIEDIELVQLGGFWDIDELYSAGRKLENQVDYVLAGQVQAGNDLIEISAELRKSDRDRPVWQEKYTTSGDDFLEVQNRIILAVISELKMAANNREVPTRAITDNKAAYRDYLIGQDLMRRGEESHLRQAISRFQSAQDKDAGFTLALASECRSNLELFRLTKNAEDYQRGKENCTRLSALQDQGIEANLAMAELYDTGGELEAAKSHFLQVLELDAKNPDANMGLADILVREEDMQRAHAFYQAAVKAHPTYWKAQNALGAFYLRSGMYHQAIESFIRVTELVDDNATAFNNLGAARLYGGDFAGASQAWQVSTNLDPNSASFSNMGAALFYARKYANAIQSYRAALELNPEDHRVWGNMAEALLLDGTDPKETRHAYNTAIRYAEAVIAVNPADAFTLSRLAVYYAAIDNDEKALSIMSSAQDIAGLDIDVLYDRAVALTLMDQLPDAKEVITKAIEAGYPAVLIQADPLLNRQ